MMLPKINTHTQNILFLIKKKLVGSLQNLWETEELGLKVVEVGKKCSKLFRQL